MDASNDKKFKVLGTSAHKGMSVTGKLHRYGQLQETLYREDNEEIHLAVDEQSRDKTTMSEHMAQCKYK